MHVGMDVEVAVPAFHATRNKLVTCRQIQKNTLNLLHLYNPFGTVFVLPLYVYVVHTVVKYTLTFSHRKKMKKITSSPSPCNLHLFCSTSSTPVFTNLLKVVLRNLFVICALRYLPQHHALIYLHCRNVPDIEPEVPYHIFRSTHLVPPLNPLSCFYPSETSTPSHDLPRHHSPPFFL